MQRQCTIGPDTRALSQPKRVDLLQSLPSVPALICVVLLAVPHAQVVIADDRQAGYFQHIWRRLSWPHPLRILRQHPFPDNTCFTRAIIAPYTAHAQSLLTYKAGSVDEVLCESVVLQGVSRWLRHLFRDLLPFAAAPTSGRTPGPPDSTGQHGSGAAAGLESSTGQPGLHAGGFRGGGGVLRDLAPLRPSPTQSSPPLQLLYVVWLSRRRFEQQRAPTLTDWQKARVLSDQQQEELVLGLQRAVLQWNAQTCMTSEQKDCKKRSVMFALQVGHRFSATLGCFVGCTKPGWAYLSQEVMLQDALRATSAPASSQAAHGALPVSLQVLKWLGEHPAAWTHAQYNQQQQKPAAAAAAAALHSPCGCDGHKDGLHSSLV